MTDAPSLPPIRDIIRSYELDAKKSLGQNFLLDLNLTRRIAKSAGDLSGRTVVEIGPGPGGLTRALLESDADKVVAIERDPRCIEACGVLKVAYGDRFEVINADALSVDVTTLAVGPIKIVANLPYNVATPLLIGWLRQADRLDGMTLMFQKEVADRLVAEPGSKTYGRLSVIAQWRCEARIAFNLDRKAFIPPPKVTSTVVNLIPRRTPLGDCAMEALEAVTQAAFGQRRKMLRQSLKTLNLDKSLESLDIDPQARAETLDIPAFCRLAGALSGPQNTIS